MEISKVVEELAYVTLDPSLPVAHRALWAGVRYLVEREGARERNEQAKEANALDARKTDEQYQREKKRREVASESL